jgi:FixJ family two-component response regulator
MARRDLSDGEDQHVPLESSRHGRADKITELPVPTVAVVDDDPGVREALKDLLTSIGLHVELFGSAQGFLGQISPERMQCLVLDVRLPGKSGLELHEDLIKANIAVPVIFISGYADVRMAVRAMKMGAVDFLAKPFSEQELLDAVQSAIRCDQIRRERQRVIAEVQRRFESLTAREQEMMSHVVSGRRNKVIAAGMGVTEVTVKAHRNQVMRKMAVRSVAELIGMAQLLGQEQAQPAALISSSLHQHAAAADA